MNESTDIDEGKNDLEAIPAAPKPDEEGVDTQVAQSAPSLGGENDDLQADPTPPQPEGEKTGTGEESFIPKPDDGKVEVKSSRFPSIGTGDGDFRSERNIDMLMDLELSVAVELGRIQMYVKDILELGPGAVVELNKFSGEPVDIYVNDKIFAEGEVVVVEQNFGVRITAMVGPDEKLGNLK